ncbi:hypothetical protein GCM10010307_33220 [Streptomyces vastus]|uniref:EamA domain-containing protein n=1 Tax=Streptomyces vastus TaxID=285451 RepID=A0ABN3QVE7_9ACTN
MYYEITQSIVVDMTAATPSRPHPRTRTPAGTQYPTHPSPSAPPNTTAPKPRRPLDWRVRFGILSLIWGFSFLLIKVGTEGYAPFQVTLGRLAFGTLVLATALA